MTYKKCISFNSRFIELKNQVFFEMSNGEECSFFKSLSIVKKHLELIQAIEESGFMARFLETPKQSFGYEFKPKHLLALPYAASALALWGLGASSDEHYVKLGTLLPATVMTYPAAVLPKYVQEVRYNWAISSAWDRFALWLDKNHSLVFEKLRDHIDIIPDSTLAFVFDHYSKKGLDGSAVDEFKLPILKSLLHKTTHDFAKQWIELSNIERRDICDFLIDNDINDEQISFLIQILRRNEDRCDPTESVEGSVVIEIENKQLKPEEINQITQKLIEKRVDLSTIKQWCDFSRTELSDEVKLNVIKDLINQEKAYSDDYKWLLPNSEFYGFAHNFDTPKHSLEELNEHLQGLESLKAIQDSSIIKQLLAKLTDSLLLSLDWLTKMPDEVFLLKNFFQADNVYKLMMLIENEDSPAFKLINLLAENMDISRTIILGEDWRCPVYFDSSFNNSFSLVIPMPVQPNPPSSNVFTVECIDRFDEHPSNRTLIDSFLMLNFDDASNLRKIVF